MTLQEIGVNSIRQIIVLLMDNVYIYITHKFDLKLYVLQ